MATYYVMTTGNDTTGDGSVGNPWATPGKAAGAFAAGDTVFIKAGTYTFTTSTPNIAGGIVNLTGNGSDSLLDSWIGYDTNATVLNTDANRPLFQVASSGLTSASVYTYNPASTVGNLLIRNIRLDGQLKTGIKGWDIRGNAAGSMLQNLTAENCTNNGISPAAGNNFVIGCQITGCSTAAAFYPGSRTYVYACTANANTISAFNSSASGGVVYDRCIAYGNTGGSTDGFNIAGGTVQMTAMNCISYGNGRDGFRNDSGNARGLWFTNCAAVANGSYGFNRSGNSPMILHLCAGGIPNTSGNENGITHSFGFITLTVDPFTNAAGGDFSLNNTAGGGAALRAIGYPGIFPGGTTTGYLDIGAAQHQDSGGGGLASSIFGGLVIR